MSVAQAPAPLERRPWLLVTAAGSAAVALGAALRASGAQSVPELQNFFLVFSSLLIEAVPFVLLGALVSAFIEVFVPAAAFERIGLLPRPLQLPAAAMAGIAFPVCECGSVPVARRMASKGLAPQAAVAFMLAAPILNPIVIASTLVAYRGRDDMWLVLFGRLGIGLLAAIAVGWAVGSKRSGDLLRTACDAPDDHRDGSRRDSFFAHLAADFVFMARFLVLGAAVAALMQTFVPQSLVAGVAGTPVLDVLVLMGLAYVLSLCSESDAFVAASFVQFGVGAQVAFLAFGPILDTKLTFLYRGTFRPGFLKTVVFVAGDVILAGALWIEVLA